MIRMNQSDPHPSVDAKRLLPENFWTVGTTPMTHAEAEEAAGFIAERFSDVRAFAVDPRASLLLGLDRWTAEVVREALVRYTGPGRYVANLVEDIDDFLTYGHPYDPDEDLPRLEN